MSENNRPDSSLLTGLAETARPDTSSLLGVSEIAQRLGVKPNTVSQWRLRDIGFPDPLVTLSMGPVWWAPDIDAWSKSR